MRERIMEWRGIPGLNARPVDADQESIREFLAGDPRGFDRLFERYHGYVYNICLGILARPDDAEDVTQEAFLRVHRSLASFRGSARFSTWLYRVAVNCSLEHARRRGREVAASDLVESEQEPDRGDAVEETVLRKLEDEQVRRALALLRLPQRTVLTLHYLQGLSVEEIAQVLGCAGGTVKVRLHRARKALRDVLVTLENRHEDALPAR